MKEEEEYQQPWYIRFALDKLRESTNRHEGLATLIREMRIQTPELTVEDLMDYFDIPKEEQPKVLELLESQNQ